ncbi:MAG: hypothetical protein GY792_02435 [Gammaproteobacteria bacterium]|nr:hypothetical protein [Gammaproteobacteria bacterium]
MKIIGHKRIVFAFFLTILTGACTAVTEAATAIMPLGNSITKGIGPGEADCELGYRRPLYLKLTNAGYFVDFMGSEKHPKDFCANVYGVPIDFSADHEGHPGKKTYQILDNLYKQRENWLGNHHADVILLHIGTNDIKDVKAGNQTPQGVANEVGKILDKINQYESDTGATVTVILARIINQVPKNSLVTTYNQKLQSMASARIANGDKIIVVDMENSGLDYCLESNGGDFDDSLHPNTNGYAKMANVWYSALKQILPSPSDALHNWTPRSSGTSSDLKGIACVINNPCVTVGENGTILTSTDGKTWTARISGTVANLTAVTYGKGTFVTAGQAGTILTSSDGVSWTKRTPGIAEQLWGISYGNGIFIAVGQRGIIITSPDRVVWTPRTVAASSLRGVAYSKGTFVTVGWDGRIFSSTNGTTWTLRNSGTNKVVGSVVYGKGNFVAVGSSGTILTSPDGISWKQRISGTSNTIYRLTYVNDRFVAVGFGGIVLSSSNGVAWTQHTSGTLDWTNNLLGIAFVKGRYVAVGNYGRILQSDNVDTVENAELEAENYVSAMGGWTQGNSNRASGGTYMFVPIGAGDDRIGTGSALIHYMQYSFAAPGNEQHAIWIRGYGNGPGADSVWISVDGGLLNPLVTSKGTWGWNYLSGYSFAQNSTHSLKIHLREDNTYVDKIIITSDLQFQP